MSIQINKTKKSSANNYQFPNIKSQSTSNLREKKLIQVEFQQTQHKKTSSQPLLSQPKQRIKYKSQYFKQPVKNSLIQLNINGITIPDQVKITVPRPTKIVQNYNTVDLWKQKYAFFITKPQQSKSRQSSQEKQKQQNKIEPEKNEKEKSLINRQKIMSKILKNSPNTKYQYNRQIFKSEFQIKRASYSKKYKSKQPDIRIQKLKQKTAMIFSKYKKFNSKNTNQVNQKPKITNIRQSMMIPSSWDIRNSRISHKTDDDMVFDEIGKSKYK